MKTKIFNAVCKTRYLALLVVLIFTCGNVWGASATWELVTSQPADWSGEYLIVYNTKCFNGSLSSGLDQHQGVNVTISNNKITLDDSYAMIVAVSGTKYSLQTAAGAYVGRNANNNGMDFNTTWSTNYTVVFANWNNTNKTVQIKGNGGRALGNNSGPWRFYANSNAYTNVKLFKKAAASCTQNPTVSAGSNSSVTSTTATVSCASGISSLGSAGCSISSYGFVIGPSANPSIGGSGVTKHEVGTSYTTIGTSFSKDLTGLSASTTYYVRPYATNGNGTAYGPQTSFTTPALPKYTIIYNAGTGTCGTASWTQPSHGASTTLPTATAPATCSGWSFDGWCTASAGSADDNTTSPGTILKSGSSYTPTSNITLYAVYTKSGGGSATYTLVSDAASFTDGTYVVAGYASSTYYFMDGTGTSDGLGVETTGLASSNVTDGSFAASSLPSGAIEIDVEDDGEPDGDNHYYFISYTSGGDTYYMDDSGTKQSLTWTTNTTVYTYHPNFTQNAGTDGCVLLSGSGAKVSQNGSTKASFIRNYASGGSFYNDMYFFKKSSGTTYYMTSLVCCTALGTIDGSISVTDDGCSAGGLKATWTMNSTTGIASYTAEVYDDGDNLVKTVNNYTSGTEITGLNRCKMYTVKIYTVSEGAPYCAGGEIGSDVWQAHGFSYTITKNHVSLKAGEEEDETTCDAATFGATYEAESGYNLPTSITINNAGSEGTGWIWDSSTGSLLIDTAYVTGNVTVTITGVSSSCSGAYSLHTGNHGSGGWITNQCFEDADWGADDDAIWVGEFPSTNAVYVGYAGSSSYYGAEWAVGGIKTYDIPTGRTLGWNNDNPIDYYKDYPGTAIGTFHIYKNSTEVNGNYYLRFKPTTYVLRTGSDGTSWTSRDMTVSATNSHYYETTPLTLTSTLISEHAYVDLKANNVNGHVWCNFSNDRTASGNVKVKSGASTFRGTDLQASDNGAYGKFQIDITQDVDNWKLAFVPMYRITYANGGGSGSMEASAYQEISGTIAAAANGFTAPANKQFAGWSGSDGNSYAAGDNVTMNSDVTLTAQWEWIPVTAITISHSTLDKYVDDANVTLTVTSVTPSGASSSVTWSSSNPSVADVNSSTGEVDFLAVGTTTITATSTVSSGITATCAVTVWAKPSATFVDNLQNLTEDKDGNALSGYNLTAVAGTPVVFPVLANQTKGSSTCEDQHYRFVGWTTSDNNTDPQAHLVTSHTLVNGDAITYYAVWADGVEGASYTKLTSNSFNTSKSYVIGGEADGTPYYLYEYRTKWGGVSSDPSTDSPILFTLSGTAAALVICDGTNYIEACSSKTFTTTTSSTTVVLNSDGTIAGTGNWNLRFNPPAGTQGLRWYENSTTGVSAYLYEVGAGTTPSYRTSCCTNKVEAPDVTATKTSTSITLTWGDETGATGWEVSWNGGAFGSPSGTRTHTVSGLTPNTTYTWQVRATYDPLVKCGADIASGSTTTNQVYHVTYATGDGEANCNATGSTTDATDYEAGATVTLQANGFTLSGHIFNAWTEDDPDVTISSNQFTMPDHNVIITASWTAKVDKYFDRMHDQTDASHGGEVETSGPNEGKYYIPMTGCNYSVPTAVDRTTGDACQTSHYKLQGWIASSYVNTKGEITDTSKIFSPTTRPTWTATGATYYAVWAEVTE